MSPLDKESRGRKDAGKELPVSEFGQPFDMVVDDSLFDASDAEEESIETPLKEDSLLNFNRQGSSREPSPGAGPLEDLAKASMRSNQYAAIAGS